MQTTITADQERRPRVDPYDPDLPLLASQAALELDRFYLGEETTLDASHLLAQRLRNSFVDSDSGDPLPFPDRPTASLIGRTFAESRSPNVATNFNELVSKACEVANQLGRAYEGDLSERAAIAQIRDFCVALAGCAMVFQRSMQLVGHTHPSRK